MLTSAEVFSPRNIQDMEGVIAKRIKDPTLREDVRQEALLHAWIDLRRFQGASHVKTWLHAIARNQARMVRRSLRLCGAYFEVSSDAFVGEIPANRPSPEDLAGDREELARCLADVRDMDEIFQRTFDAFFVRGVLREEIARGEGVPEGTIGRRISDVRVRVAIMRNARLEPRVHLTFG